MIDIISHILAVGLIFIAINYKRYGDSKIMVFTRDWFNIFILVAISVFLLIYIK